MSTRALVDSDAEWLRFMEVGGDTPINTDLRALLDFHTVTGVPEGTVFHHEVVYGRSGGRDLTALLFARADVTERAPAVVFVHGGGWSAGTPCIHLRHAHDLAAAGYVTASIRYRLLPEATIPDCLADAKCAVRWMRANATSLGADPGRIAIAGGSAGGHLSAMVALTPDFHEGNGGHPDVSSRVQAAFLWYPATCLHDMTGSLAGIEDNLFGGDVALAREMSPLTHVHPGAPPICTVTGDRDEITTLGPIREFHSALDAAGVPNRLEVLEGRNHAYDWTPDEWPRSYDTLARFLDTYLQ